MVAWLAVGVSAAYGQGLTSSAQKRQLVKNDAVTYLFPEQVSVTAGKPSAVALHFRVAQGMHINSHTPTDEFLIPTTFSIPSGSGVELKSAIYPAGTVMALPIDPTTKLSVYTGEFVIQTRIVTTAGNHLVQGQLHYQACDNNQCLPPKTITVAIDVIGK
ncbi:MAG: protein-disulfide reductase DsbD domain-containing protein [Terracidiphilus sp.]